MTPLAIEHAEDRLERARAAYEALSQANDFRSMEVAWSEFLTAASAIYSKLEQGSKASGRSAGWFGRRKRERKDDQLLSYIHHARNSDEHGLEQLTDRMPSGIGIAPHDGYFSFSVNPNGAPREGGYHIVNHAPQSPLRIRFLPASIEVKTVTDDRFHDRFDPPVEHLGEPVRTRSAVRLAEMALIYLDRMVADAKTL